MIALVVVDNPKHWPLDIPGTEIVSSREYLTNPKYFDLKRAIVFNLSKSYRYQTVGYYVSLLARARGHRPMPSVTTLQDLKHAAIIRVASEELGSRLQSTLGPLRSDRFTLSIYFGRNMAERYDRLCQTLFAHFPAPFLRAEFARTDEWQLHSLRPIALNEIAENHRAFVVEQAARFFARPRLTGIQQPRYELAVLVNSSEVDRPSDERALRRFARAGKRFSMRVTQIEKDDFGRLGEFDALFIRETTAVNHHTYRFARRAQANGLVVIDDPESIVRCTNKVYQAELFERQGIAIPKTLVIHRDNVDRIARDLGFPCVLKRPDSSFSAGVVIARDEAELAHHLDTFLEDSELVVAQEFTPSEFDWRIGVLDGRPLYACRYYMARGHWQIQKQMVDNRRSYGRSDTLAIEDAPAHVVKLATKAANLIGSGLYGVDLKQVGRRLMVMEVNDNPSIEAGVEDAVLKDELYYAILKYFYDRLEQRGRSVVKY